MTPAEIAEIAARWAKAQRGPWRVVLVPHIGESMIVDADGGCVDGFHMSEGSEAAIARAPQDVAALLGEVERLAAEVAKMKPAWEAVENLRALNIACEALDDQRIRDNACFNRLTYEQADTYAKRNAADDALSQMTETPGERAARLRQDAREDASLSTTATRGGG